MPSTTSRVRRAAALLTGGVLAASIVAPGAFATRVAAGTPTAFEVTAAPASIPAAPTAPSAPIVVLGTAGLRWSDLDAAATPALWSLTEGAAVGSLVTRSVPEVSCPTDGWLALGSGNRAAAPRPAARCVEPVDPADDGLVPGWEGILAERDEAGYGARLGLLGALLAEHGRTAIAVGPGAAIALANPDGVVAQHVPAPPDTAALAAEVARASRDADLVVVDVGSVMTADDAASRATGVARVEERVAAVLDTLDRSSRVMLASLADAGPEPRLQVLALTGLGVPPGEVLRSASTRQDGLVLATDLLPTLLGALDLPGTAVAGARVTGAEAPESAAPGSTPTGGGNEARIAAMVDLDRHASAVRDVGPAFFALLVIANVALLATWWLAGERPGPSALRRLRTAGVVVGALPVATLLANLVPWWRTGAPGLALLLATLGAAGLLAAFAVGGPWRRARLGPLTVVAAVTGLAIMADVVTGSRVQLGSVLGAHPLLAGRFYGINNSGFALLLVASLLVGAVLGTRLTARGHRVLGAVLVAVVGVVTTVVDGLPGLGSDLGGPPALVPAFAVLALLVAGVRVGWRRLVLVLLAGGLVVIGFAVLDWLRPESARTHLGRFVATTLDGGLGEVVGRKLAQNLEILATAGLVLLGILAVATLVWVVGRRRPGSRTVRGTRHQLTGLGTAEPALRHALSAITLGLVLGMLVNDSGAAIPAVGLALAVPLLLATLATWLIDATGGTPSSAPVVRDEAASGP